MHSPWGMLYQIVKDTGWSWHDILWKTPRINLLLMMADRPNFKKEKEKQPKSEPISGKGLAAKLKGKTFKSK